MRNIDPVDISKIYMPRRFVKSISSRSLIPLIMLEACVESGRTYQAYKRGGFDEGRERITEEFIGALFWFSGVPGFNKIIDVLVGKNILKLPFTDFDTGKDAARDSMANFIKRMNVKDEEAAEKLIAKYKFGKVAAAVVLANCLVGFAVPKLNQAITRNLRKKRNIDNRNNSNNDNLLFAKTGMDVFLNKNERNKDISFGGITPQGLLNFVNNFENTPKYQLISEDIGVATGRGICARNKYERTEVLFRDISSCYFYMFNMPVMAMLLNKLEHGSSNRLDPVSAQVTTDHLLEILEKNGGKMSIEDFKAAVLGDKSLEYKITPDLDRILAKNGGRIELDEFTKMFKDVDKENARKMSELQPKLYGKSILTKPQIEDLFKGGKINSPEYLHDLYTIATSNDNLFKVGKAAFLDEFKFVSTQSLSAKKQEAIDFVKEIISKAEKSARKKEAFITEELVKSMNKNNFVKNAFNWGAGFAVSALFLSTLIPKMQYWITRMRTGKNQFPGTTDYSKTT